MSLAEPRDRAELRDRRSPFSRQEFVSRHWSDADLTEAIILQREDAFVELHRRLAPSVRAVVRNVLGSSPGCDDVVAEVFESLWMAPHHFDPTRGSILTFLRMEARGRSLDLLRSESKRQLRERGRTEATRSTQIDTEELVIESERSALIARAIALLPSTEREPIYLAFFVGMSYSAAAIHLNLPEGTVKSRIRNGLRHLRFSAQLKDLWQSSPSRVFEGSSERPVLQMANLDQ